MKVSFSAINPMVNFNHQVKQNGFKYSNLKPLSQDTVSFAGCAEREAERKEDIEKFKRQLEEKGINVETSAPEEIFKALGIGCRVDEKDGLLILDEYRGPNYLVSIHDLGIDENRLFKSIKEIEGTADFRNTKVKSLGELQSIGGRAYFENSQVTDLGNLQSIGENAYFSGLEMTSLGKLQSIGGNAYFGSSKLKSLGELKSIGGKADFSFSQVTDLGKLGKIEGDVRIDNSKLKQRNFWRIKVGGKFIK